MKIDLKLRFSDRMSGGRRIFEVLVIYKKGYDMRLMLSLIRYEMFENLTVKQLMVKPIPITAHTEKHCNKAINEHHHNHQCNTHTRTITIIY
uniref:CSON007355 protein n=1 Tax=Culicoides sonorensis TaxID=179676 RepID=A0A336LXN5_CULSO